MTVFNIRALVGFGDITELKDLVSTVDIAGAMIQNSGMKSFPGSRFRASAANCMIAIVAAWFVARSGGAETKAGVNKFEKDILAFEAADKKSPPPRGAILFAGDSQFTRWKTIHEDLPEYTVINRGFGGSQMTDLLHYTDRIVIPYHPRLIVVNEGGNDLHGGRTPEQLLADFKAFVDKVHGALPETKIIMSSLTPSPARWSEVETRKVTNRMLREYIATQKNVTFVDLFDAYLGPDGKPNDEYFVEDHLHHSAAGYRVRLKHTRPLLGKPDKK